MFSTNQDIFKFEKCFTNHRNQILIPTSGSTSSKIKTHFFQPVCVGGLAPVIIFKLSGSNKAKNIVLNKSVPNWQITETSCVPSVHEICD